MIGSALAALAFIALAILACFWMIHVSYRGASKRTLPGPPVPGHAIADGLSERLRARLARVRDPMLQLAIGSRLEAAQRHPPAERGLLVMELSLESHRLAPETARTSAATSALGPEGPLALDLLAAPTDARAARVARAVLAGIGPRLTGVCGPSWPGGSSSAQVRFPPRTRRSRRCSTQAACAPGPLAWSSWAGRASAPSAARRCSRPAPARSAARCRSRAFPGCSRSFPTAASPKRRATRRRARRSGRTPARPGARCARRRISSSSPGVLRARRALRHPRPRANNPLAGVRGLLQLLVARLEDPSTSGSRASRRRRRCGSRQLVAQLTRAVERESGPAVSVALRPLLDAALAPIERTLAERRGSPSRGRSPRQGGARGSARAPPGAAPPVAPRGVADAARRHADPGARDGLGEVQLEVRDTAPLPADGLSRLFEPD